MPVGILPGSEQDFGMDPERILAGAGSMPSPEPGPRRTPLERLLGRTLFLPPLEPSSETLLGNNRIIMIC